MNDRIEQLKRDIEGACDTGLSRRLRDQHREAALEAVEILDAFSPVVVCKDAKPAPLGLTLQVGKQTYLSIVDRDEKIAAEGLATVERADITVDKDDFALYRDLDDPGRPWLAKFKQTADIRVHFDTLSVRELTLKEPRCVVCETLGKDPSVVHGEEDTP